MKKSVTKTVCLLLSVLMLLSGLPMLTPSVSAATVVGENAVYTYGAKSDMMKIADYSDADYQAAKALLQPSEDLKALLDSGVGSEQAPFVVKNFHQLRLLFFWMNFYNCTTQFQFVNNSETVTLKPLWNSLLTGYAKKAGDYDLSRVYVRLGSDVNAAVTDADCLSLFEISVNKEKNHDGNTRFLTLVVPAVLNLDTNGRNLLITLDGSRTNEEYYLFTGYNGASLNLSDEKHEGSLTVKSNLRYPPDADFENLKNFSPPFGIAAFTNITAEYVGLKTVSSTGTSSLLFGGQNGSFSHCTMEYYRHSSATTAMMNASVYATPLNFDKSVTLKYCVFNRNTTDRNVVTVRGSRIYIEKTDIPEGASSSAATSVKINRSKVGGSVNLNIADNCRIDLAFTDITENISVTQADYSAVSADITMEHCTAEAYSDVIECNSLTMNDCRFVSENEKRFNVICAKSVTVHNSVFVVNNKNNGAVNFNRLKEADYDFVRFTDTQLVNQAAGGSAVKLPELFGYKTEKDEFNVEQVVAYPSLDKNFFFRNCSFTISLADNNTYIHTNPTHLDWSGVDESSLNSEQRYLGVKLLLSKCTGQKICFVNMVGKVAQNEYKDLNAAYFSSMSGHKNTGEFLSAFAAVLQYAAYPLSSLVIADEKTAKYTLDYNLNGGSLICRQVSESQYADGKVSVAYGEEEVFKNGYAFKGWTTDPAGRVAEYQKGDKITLTQDTTLYAVFQRPADVTYDFNGGRDEATGKTSAVCTYYEGQTVQVNKNGAKAMFTPVKDGMVLAGWSTRSNPSAVQYQDGGEFTVDGNVTLYAVWTFDTTAYRVEFRDGGGNKITAYTQYAGTSFTVPAAPAVKTGYRFVNWYDQTNAQYYAPGDKYIVGKKDSVVVARVEKIPDSEIMHSVSAVNITGVTKPVEEEACVTDGTLTCDAGCKAEYAGGNQTWQYKDSHGYTIWLSPGDDFLGGVNYTVRVRVTPQADNYTFSTDTVFKINGNTAKVVSVDGRTYTVSAEMFCRNDSKITDVKITGFTAPLAGAKPQTTVTAAGTTAYLSSVGTVKWYVDSAVFTGSFAAGQVYHAEITVKSLAVSWQFSKNVKVSINGSDAAVKEILYGKDNMSITVILEAMSADKTAISVCAVTGVPEPWVNSAPEYPALACATDQYTAEIDGWTQFRFNDERQVDIYDGGGYKTFNEYKVRVYITVTPKNGYALADNPRVSINGKTATKDGSVYYIDFIPKQAEKITSLSLAGVPTLTAGEAIDFNPQIVSETPHTKAEINTEEITIWNGYEDTAVTPVWTITDMDSNVEEKLESGAKVQKGGYYSLYVAVTHDTGYDWDEEINFRLSANDGLLCVYEVLDEAYGIKENGNTRYFKIVTCGMAGEKQASVSLTGFVSPTACVPPNINRAGVKSADADIRSAYWLNAEGEIQTEEFVAGKKYQLRLIVTPRDYKSFDENTQVNLEGGIVGTASYSPAFNQGGCLIITTVPYTAADHLFNLLTLPDENETEAEKHLASVATCTAGAMYDYYCECGENSTRTAEYGFALGHDFNKKTVSAEALKAAATCTAAAEYYYTCTRCKQLSGEKTFTDGKPKGHTQSSAWTVTDTDHSKKCLNCGYVYPETVGKHHWEKTGTEKNGDDVCTCSVCQARKTVSAGYILGDIDGNGAIEAADARLALRASVGLEVFNEIQTRAADADKNLKVEAADARLILRASVGLENPDDW